MRDHRDIQDAYDRVADESIKLQESGFRLAEALEREPCPEVEHPSRHAYLLAEASGS